MKILAASVPVLLYAGASFLPLQHQAQPQARPHVQPQAQPQIQPQCQPQIQRQDTPNKQDKKATPAGKEDYEVDGSHSVVIFRVEHLGVSKFWGRFNKISGSFTFDDKSPADSSVDITVASDSIDSANAGRDRHLKSPQFFNVKEHTEIKFTGSKFEKVGDKTYKLTGELTLLGKKKQVVAEVLFVGRRKNMRRFGSRAGFEARFSIKRSDFGMNFMVKNGSLGDAVDLVVAIEGKLKK